MGKYKLKVFRWLSTQMILFRYDMNDIYKNIKEHNTNYLKY